MSIKSLNTAVEAIVTKFENDRDLLQSKLYHLEHDIISNPPNDPVFGDPTNRIGVIIKTKKRFTVYYNGLYIASAVTLEKIVHMIFVDDFTKSLRIIHASLQSLTFPADTPDDVISPLNDIIKSSPVAAKRAKHSRKSPRYTYS